MDDFDSVLLVSFGGPEGPQDVMPFLENVLRGKNVPEERKREVAENYALFDGKSPLNGFMRGLQKDLGSVLLKNGQDMPVYWGNRNWTPYLKDTLSTMRAEGKKRPIVFFTSAFSSYSGCRQYRENIQQAQEALDWKEFSFEKIRPFFNHPYFVRANAEEILEAIKSSSEVDPSSIRLIFTAHSLPLEMAKGCDYEKQLSDACESVSEMAGFSSWQLAYQSRSGPPSQPWLEPSILEAIRAAKIEGKKAVLICPIGFVTDHVEVLFDLDHQARQLTQELGLLFVRSRTAGHHPLFLSMLTDLIDEVRSKTEVQTTGKLGPKTDACSPHCCLPGKGRPKPLDETEKARAIGLKLWFPPLLLFATMALGVWIFFRDRLQGVF